MCRVPLHSPFRPRLWREAALRLETVAHDLACRWRHNRLRLLQVRQARPTVAHKRRHSQGRRPRHRRIPGSRIQDPPLPVGCRCRRGGGPDRYSRVRPFTCLRHKPENLTSRSARTIFALITSGTDSKEKNGTAQRPSLPEMNELRTPNGKLSSALTVVPRRLPDGRLR
jgi:hypothetical protein